MNTYQARIQQALQTSGPIPMAKLSGLPTVGSIDFGSPGGFLGTVVPYLLYALLLVFIILFILVIVHYSGVYPIFNFGDNPEALIQLTAPDWQKSWNNKDTIYRGLPSATLLPKKDYSLVMDVKVTAISPSPTMGNIFVIAYKTPAVVDTTTPSPEGSFKIGDKTYIVTPPANFNFLNTPSVPTGNNPSLTIAYNSLGGELTVYYIVTSGATSYLQSISTPIDPLKKYRVGVVVTDKIIELYLDGKLANTKVAGGTTIEGTETDALVSTPTTFGSNVRVANLFTTGRIVSSGEIRALGGPAEMNES